MVAARSQRHCARADRFRFTMARTVRKPPKGERPRAGLSNYAVAALIAGAIAVLAAAALQYHHKVERPKRSASPTPTSSENK